MKTAKSTSYAAKRGIQKAYATKRMELQGLRGRERGIPKGGRRIL